MPIKDHTQLDFEESSNNPPFISENAILQLGFHFPIPIFPIFVEEMEEL